MKYYLALFEKDAGSEEDYVRVVEAKSVLGTKPQIGEHFESDHLTLLLGNIDDQGCLARLATLTRYLDEVAADPDLIDWENALNDFATFCEKAGEARVLRKAKEQGITIELS